MKSRSVGLGQLVIKLQLPLWKAPWKKDRKEGNWEDIKVATVVVVVVLVWKALLMSPMSFRTI